MYNSVVIASSFLLGLSACNSHRNEKPKPHFQIRISGTGLANLKSEIFSKGKQKFLMFGDPAQFMFFKNTDSIYYLFPLGEKSISQRLDTTNIGLNEQMTFTVRLSTNHLANHPKSTTKTILRVALLANGKVVRSVHIPTATNISKNSTTQDSTATFTFNSGNI
ncbi:hypothetical protein [Hymenobacter baengnokdamensis]|uniref:hypothetical protein n=1 Tax=Hymenobacter baengnokdamensis TaxID=2615203 RepID=UPI0012465948|nr:hypothetical protein [Hymenobacter baengnokdamensis]